MVDAVAPEVVFVVARGENAFFAELAAVLNKEMRALGVESSLALGAFPPPDPKRVYVVLPPHEYASLEGDAVLERPELLARTILMCAEKPGTPWFDGNLRWTAGAGAVFDINPRGVAGFRRRGVDASRLALGYTTEWDTRTDRWDEGRDIDVLFLGSRSGRRERLLDACGEVLQRYNSRLVISDNDRPNVATSESFLAGPEKHGVLRRARVLLNLHSDEEPYFEWLRVVEAVHCGAVVVSEHSSGVSPLRAGRDFFSTSAASLPWVLSYALEHEEHLREMRRSAHDALRDRPMGSVAATLAFTAASLVAA
jgi:hypothetical protein